MSDIRTADERHVYSHQTGEWGQRFNPSHGMESAGISRSWTVVGAVALAVGVLACYHFAPDFRRYLKIKSM